MSSRVTSPTGCPVVGPFRRLAHRNLRRGSSVCLYQSDLSFYRQKGWLDLDRAAIGDAELQMRAAIMPSVGDIP
jgi:hypothetical protein